MDFLPRIAAFASFARGTSQIRKAALFLFCVAVLLVGGATAVRGQSALDGFDPNANGAIQVVVVQPDGRILLGGDFTTLSPNGGGAVTRNRIARLNPDGTLDTVFNPNASSTVAAIALQADGKILVGGNFTNIGGQPRSYIARLDATTGLADSFDPNANSPVSSIVVQADGKILAGGAFAASFGANTIGGATRNYIARLDPTTGLADAFNANANNLVFAIAVQADGKILVGGLFRNIGGQPRNRIARLHAKTGLVDSFNPNANGFVTAIAVQADGKILVGGGFNAESGLNTIGGQTRNFIARLDATTGLADSFHPNANGFVNSIAVQADGKILAGGLFSIIDVQTRNGLARLDATTGLADSFIPNAAADSSFYSIAVQADGKILAGGVCTSIGGQTRNNIGRLETDGRLDQTLNPSTGGIAVYATAVQADGKILIGGSFTSVGGVPRNNIARLNPDGTLDPAFNPNAEDVVYAIAVQADGKILVGGNFRPPSGIGGQARMCLARLDPTTGLADSFNPFANSLVYAIAVQADGKILVGGIFHGANSIGGATRNYIARLDPMTGLADSFNPDATGSVRSIALQADGKILAGGEFRDIGGATRRCIARLDPATGLADAFDPGTAIEVVFAVAVQPDGKILVGGNFNGPNGIGGQTRNRIARLEAATGLADSFDPNANDIVYSIAVQADGKILAGGNFNGANSIGGQMRNHIARLEAATGLADSFNPNANDHVRSIAVQADGKILAGGFFTSIGGEPRSLFARLSNDTAALQNLAVTENTVTWTRGGSSPQFRRVTFESSTDNVNYTLLGNATAAGSNWILTGLSLPAEQNIYIRARGYYPSGWLNGSESITEFVWNAFIVPPGTLGNTSTRLRVETGDNVLIGGMIATGIAGKRVIIRAMGPSLTAFGVPGALANPTLDLFQGSTLLFSNDDWNTSTQQAEIANSGLAPSNAAEAAIIWTLTPGQNYTAIVRGKDGTTGVGVVEAYDLEPAAASKLGNISTRGFVGVDDNVMIAGLIAGNGASLRILVRALGPTLSDFGVAGALANPTLDLVNANGTVIRSSDNWKDDPQQRAAIEAAGLAPGHDEEAALVETVAPGAYTAIVRGSGRTSGVGLVEAYNIP